MAQDYKIRIKIERRTDLTGQISWVFFPSFTEQKGNTRMMATDGEWGEMLDFDGEITDYLDAIVESVKQRIREHYVRKEGGDDGGEGH